MSGSSVSAIGCDEKLFKHAVSGATAAWYHAILVEQPADVLRNREARRQARRLDAY